MSYIAYCLTCREILHQDNKIKPPMDAARLHVVGSTLLRNTNMVVSPDICKKYGPHPGHQIIVGKLMHTDELLMDKAPKLN